MEELDKTIKELHTFQKWRRGANIEMPNPKELGKTIDNTIRILRKIKNKKHYELQKIYTRKYYRVKRK